MDILVVLVKFQKDHGLEIGLLKMTDLIGSIHLLTLKEIKTIYFLIT